jgi:hypothetical protein
MRIPSSSDDLHQIAQANIFLKQTNLAVFGSKTTKGHKQCQTLALVSERVRYDELWY